MTSLFCASDNVEKNIKEQNNQQSNTLPSHFQNTHTLTLVYFRTSLVVLSSVRENEFVLYLSHYVLRQIDNGKKEQFSQGLSSNVRDETLTLVSLAHFSQRSDWVRLY